MSVVLQSLTFHVENGFSKIWKIDESSQTSWNGKATHWFFQLDSCVRVATIFSLPLIDLSKKGKIPRILTLPICWKTLVRCIPATAAATHPWNPCQRSAVSLSRFRLPQLPASAALAVFVLVLRLRLPSLRAVLLPPGRQSAGSPAAAAHRLPAGTAAAEVSLLDGVECFCCFPHCWNSTPACLLVPAWLLPSLSPFPFYLLFFLSSSLSHSLSHSPQHTASSRLSFKQPLKP